jgi:glyoxylase-like metal-dependent hydrolase (beta-lactamase superfamily II)
MIVSEEGLKPVAALLTHGHLDHTFSVKPLADGYEIPAYIHSEDRRFIADPAGIHGPQFVDQLRGLNFAEPVKVENLKDGSTLDFLGMKIQAIHAPGHTRGSLMFLINEEVLLSGDVLFAGSIGRTDLPTGSATDMRSTLSKKVLTLDDSIRVLPGHGDETTIKYERKTNPYLKELR